jgi:hypothetical protein
MDEKGGEWGSGGVGEEGAHGEGGEAKSQYFRLAPPPTQKCGGSSWGVALGRTSQPSTIALRAGSGGGVGGRSEPPLRARDVRGSS